MWYIFNNKNECIGKCDAKPDELDLSYREETCIEINDPTILKLDIIDIILSKGEPTKKVADAQTAEDKANQIATEFQKQILELKDALAIATLAGNDTVIEELRTEYAALMMEYQTKLEAVNNG